MGTVTIASSDVYSAKPTVFIGVPELFDHRQFGVHSFIFSNVVHTLKCIRYKHFMNDIEYNTIRNVSLVYMVEQVTTKL